MTRKSPKKRKPITLKKCCLRGYFEHVEGRNGLWRFTERKGFLFRCLTCRTKVWSDDHDAAIRAEKGGRDGR